MSDKNNEYNISMPYITSSQVILNIDGVKTYGLSKGDVYPLSTGETLVIKDILVQDYVGGEKKVWFTIGNFVNKSSGNNTIQSCKSFEIRTDGVLDQCDSLFNGSTCINGLFLGGNPNHMMTVPLGCEDKNVGNTFEGFFYDVYAFNESIKKVYASVTCCMSF